YCERSRRPVEARLPQLAGSVGLRPRTVADQRWTVRMATVPLPLRTLRQQRTQFRFGEVAPLADFQVAERELDDAHPLQAAHVVAEDLAHAPDLAIEALGQHDAEHAIGPLRRTLDAARL